MSDKLPCPKCFAGIPNVCQLRMIGCVNESCKWAWPEGGAVTGKNYQDAVAKWNANVRRELER